MSVVTLVDDTEKLVSHFKKQEWQELSELEECFNNVLTLVEEEDEFNTTLTRLCLDYFIYQNSKDSDTLSRLADTLKNKGDLDHALSLLELQKSKSFKDYRIILECYLIKRPQWTKEADELITLARNEVLEEEMKHLQLIYEVYTDEEQFISHFEKYQESKRLFMSQAWFKLPLQSHKKVIDLTNIILQICISKEQYDIAWDIYESISKQIVDSTCIKTMIKIASNGFYSSLLLKKGKHPIGEEEELKWEGRCWYGIDNVNN